MAPRILSVSDVTRLITHRLESEAQLQHLQVRGEISNYKRHTSGHHYLTLKDERSQLRAVMFRRQAEQLSFQPENGLQVIARGRIGVYERAGEYQLYIDELIFDGPGGLAAAFEALKAKLAAEGLFDEARKRPLPRFPTCIGLITSPTGAALRDLVSLIRRRYPSVELIFCPAVVQGAEASASLVRALQRMNRLAQVDVLILGRGGGSLEDLWAFNEEAVARAIFASRIPVISAVGHETDFTIADFVADRRAPTPSAAAEMVVPDRAELRRHLEGLHTRLETALARTLEAARERLETLATRRAWRHPEDRLEAWFRAVEELAERQDRAVQRGLSQRRERLAGLEQTLQALSPRRVLDRGYSLFLRLPEREVISRVNQVEVGQRGEILLRDGCVTCRVEQIQGG